MFVNKRFINRVVKLTEVDNMTIKDIAIKLKCSETTIKRIRKEHGITKRNHAVKKKYYCYMCGNAIHIYKDEVSRLMCPDCRRINKKGGEFKNESV